MNKTILTALIALSVVAITPVYAGVQDMVPDFVSEQFKGQETVFVYDPQSASVEILSDWSLNTEFSNNSFVPSEGNVLTLTAITSTVQSQTATYGIPSAYVITHTYGDNASTRAVVNGQTVGFMGYDQESGTFELPRAGQQYSIEFRGCNVSFTDVQGQTFGNGIIEDCKTEQTPFLKGTAPGIVVSGILQTTS